MNGNAPGIYVVDAGFGDGVGVVADIVFKVIAVFANVVGYDGAAIFQMDGVSPRSAWSKHPKKQELPYKEEGSDTQAHSGAF